MTIDIFEAVVDAVGSRHQFDHPDVGMAANPRRLVKQRPAGEVVLDGVGNPHNLGAILRTAAFFGMRRVLLSDHRGQAGPSPPAGGASAPESRSGRK